MEYGDVFVRDPASLVDLNNTIEYSADSLLKIEESVDRYLDGVKEVLEKQRDIIKEKLDEAEVALSEAEADLSSCEASQTQDEDGNYTPSCDSERSAVENARKEVEIWKKNYDAACRIISEMDYEIDNYRRSGGPLYPSGGKYFIRYLAEDHTDKATESLRGCIEIITDYQESRATDGEFPVEVTIENPNKTEDDKPLTEDEKKVRFGEFANEIVKKQAENSGEIAGANRVMKCPDCGRPKALCVCGSIRKDMIIYNRN